MGVSSHQAKDGASNGTQNVNVTGTTGLSAWDHGQVSVGTSAVQVASSPIANRKTISVKALSTNTQTVFIGSSNAVTTSTGYPLDAGSSVELDLVAGANIFAISSAGGQTVGFAEVA